MKTSTLLQVISALLILLFIYTAVSKLLDFEHFKEQMYNQNFPHWFATVLIWSLPEIEILTGLMLLARRSQIYGLYLSFFLLASFTGYIALVLLNYFERVPCSCGGVIKAFGWKMHLAFNLFFLLLSSIGIYMTNRERRLVGTER